MDGVGVDYWLRWQVLVCAIIFILPSAVAIVLLRVRKRADPADMWSPCWKNLHPRWLLVYRAFAFFAMAFLLYQTVAAFGFFVFFFYTQWTFALVMVYFGLATVVSIKGCRVHSKKPFTQSREKARFLKKDSEDINYETTSASKEKKSEGITNLELNHNLTPDEQLGILEYLLQAIYQSCAGAVVLTDIVFWGLLLPFMMDENFQLTLLIGCMHSVNGVFLILESALNRTPFSWFGFNYFILWSCSYVIFQWILHVCCFTWWPYPFLDLSAPWAPLWYLGLALIHVPCYWIYVMLTKAKEAAFSRMFPSSFVRVSTKKKLD